ncbi:MAG TPA: glycosyltransferase family 39 protein [Methylomirabilota bacterium]|nr:glycosyltransferase family 39 protein [Methylomirabilota bacterium]
MAASLALVGYLVWGSRSWPLIHDAPLMHYVAWLMSQGAVPYRDAFDMNLPGAYLIHSAVLATAGPSDLAWRLFDLAWLAATCLLLYAYCRPIGDHEAALLAALLFALYHLSGGAWRAGQRDFLLSLFLLAGAYGVSRALEEGGPALPLLLGGLALGAGMTLKPHAGLYWLGCAAAAGSSLRRAQRPALARAGVVLGGGLVIPALVFGWLAWRGGLRPFVEILAGYVLPLYSQVGRVGPWQPFGGYRWGWALWSLLLALGVLGLLSRAAQGWACRRVLALLGALYGLVHFIVQGKGWEYQLYPLAMFLVILAAPALARATASGEPRGLAAFARPAGLAVAAALVLVLGAKGADAQEAPWIADKARRVAAVTRDLEPLVPPGATAQVLDVTEGGVHALLNLHLRQPTRFLYDFHFFHDVGDRRIQALRDELAGGLVRTPPAAVVVFRDTWNRPGYERLAELPRVAALLARSYELAVDGDGYRIYVWRIDEKRSRP